MTSRKQCKRYTLDGEPINLAEFIRANVEGFDENDKRALRALKPGERLLFGGGAWATFEVRCHASRTKR